MKHQGRIFIGAILRILFGLVFGITSIPRRNRNRPTEPLSVLIVRFDLMGDIVNALSAALAARERWPNASIVFMAPPRWKPIIDRCESVDEILAFDAGQLTHWPTVLNVRAWFSALRMLKNVRARHFDIACSVYGPVAGVVVALSGAAWRVGYQKEAPFCSFDEPIAGYRKNGGPHEAALATRIVADTHPSWNVLSKGASPDERITANRPHVLIHPGSSHGAAKRWPVQNWTECARLIQARAGQLTVVGLSDSSVVAHALTTAGIASSNRCGQTSLNELMDVLEDADVVISTDSGPGHLARALGTPVVMLHGPTDISIHGPGAPNCRPLRVYIPCGPCYNFERSAECQYADALCMHWLTATSVRDAVYELLG
jgi:ADP-heptose:LPS heptosyltransferase